MQRFHSSKGAKMTFFLGGEENQEYRPVREAYDYSPWTKANQGPERKRESIPGVRKNKQR